MPLEILTGASVSPRKESSFNIFMEFFAKKKTKKKNKNDLTTFTIGKALPPVEIFYLVITMRLRWY